MVHVSNLSFNKKKFSLLICCVFTLTPESPFFKTFTLQKHLSHNQLGPDFIYLDELAKLELYRALNTKTLRLFALNLLKNNLKKDSTIEKSLLVCYLKKFKYNYTNYFFITNKDYSQLPSDSTINSYALKTLFLLAGE